MTPTLFVAIAFAYAPASPSPEPPPPVKRPAPAVEVAGEYWMVWGTAVYRAAFAKGGRYVAYKSNAGPVFEGRWSLRGGVLTIEERSVGSSGGYTVTTLLLEKGKGKLRATNMTFDLFPVSKGYRKE